MNRDDMTPEEISISELFKNKSRMEQDQLLAETEVSE